jgi:hypothetical protein
MWNAFKLMAEDRPAASVRRVYEVDVTTRKLLKSPVVQSLS